jgi:hypothetical protein
MGRQSESTTSTATDNVAMRQSGHSRHSPIANLASGPQSPILTTDRTASMLYRRDDASPVAGQRTVQ